MRTQKNVIKHSTVFTILLIFLFSVGYASAEDPASFYRGKTVVFTVGSSPGGGYDTWTRLMAPAFAKVLGATVIVKNMPAGGGVVALHDIYHTKNARGLKIHTARAILPPLLETVGFPGTSARWKVEELQWIGRLSVDEPAFAVSAKKFKTFDQVRSDKEFLCGVDAAMSVSGTRTAIALEALGLSNGKIVAGYPGGSERRLAVIQGELDATSGSYDSLYRYFAAGDLKPVWVMVNKKLKKAPNVPIITDLGVTEQGKKWLDWELKTEQSGRSIVAPPDTPKDRVKFLRDAMAKAVTDPELLNKVARLKYSLQYMRGDKLQALLQSIMRLSKSEKEQLVYILKDKYMK
ncbi:Bug family tripartite tricarboxylate transporter substrate binding protein [Thermodesulfobacteriota bacterium]